MIEMIHPIKLLALFAFFSLSIKTAENKIVFTKHQEFPRAKVSGALLNSKVSYVICHDIETSSDGKYYRKCSITHGNMAEKSELSTCDMTFQGKFTNDYTVHTLSADRMLVVWCDDNKENTENLLRYTFVQFPDCKTAEATVAFDDHKTLSNAVKRYKEALTFNDDGTYDVYFANPKFCDEKVCRLTIDSQGKTIKGPTASYVPSDNPLVITEDTPVNNSVAIAELGIDTGKTRVFLVTPDGVKVLMEFPIPEWINHGFSLSQRMIRSCTNKGNMKLECETFDASGKSLSKDTLDIGNQNFSKLTMSNLPNGEFILFTQTADSRHNNITKFDANYKCLGTVELPEFTCNEGSMISLREFYKENSQNCVSSMCYDKKHVDLSKDCFDDNEFN